MRSLFGAVGLVLFLSACQTLNTPLPSDGGEGVISGADQGDWLTDPAPFNDLQFPNNWRYAAKAGLVLDGKSEQANLTWQSTDEAGRKNEIRLFGPLGSGAVKLEFSATEAILTDSKGQEYRDINAERLLARTIQWPLPVEALRYWLFASPAPGSAYRYQLNELGQLSELSQLGWELEFKDRRDYEGRRLPRKVFASKTFYEANQPREVTVKLITKSWQLP